MELTFLGTGSGVPSKERNVSSIALKVLQEQNSIWLFDCGEGSQHQILHTSVKPRKIKKIFITHLHGDHIFGLPGLLSSRSFQGGEDRLTVYGPPGIKDYIETSLAVSGTKLTYPLSIIEFSEGKIYEDTQFIVHAKHLDHNLPSYGFKIIEKDKTGELLVDKLKAQGINPGPIYQQIKENDIVRINDHDVIHSKKFIGPDKKGRIVTIMGDTRSKDTHQEFAENSDVLIHEATFGRDKADLAEAYYHSTTEQAAWLAYQANVKKLILTHISSRYQLHDEEQLRQEAQSIFPETELASDFYSVTIEAN